MVAQAGQRARLADVQDLPAIVHQLLMLSTRGCREAVLTVSSGRRPRGRFGLRGVLQGRSAATGH